MEITANAVQTVAANTDVLFTDIAVRSSVPCILYRSGSGLITLRGLTSGGQTRARFRISFGANIAIPTGGTVEAISVAPALSGEPLITSTMTVTPGVVDAYFNIAAAAYIEVASGCCTQFSIKNISAQPINVQNANLIIERVA